MFTVKRDSKTIVTTDDPAIAGAALQKAIDDGMSSIAKQATNAESTVEMLDDVEKKHVTFKVTIKEIE